MGTPPLNRKSGIVAAVATVLAGWLFLLPYPTPNPLVRWSYDLLQLILPGRIERDLAIIYMDEQAMQDYGKQPEQWDRSLHATLLDRLTTDEPRVVVFDVAMTQPRNPVADAQLAQAIQRNGRVVLAGDKVPVAGLPLGYTIVPPLELFETNAAAWGTPKVHSEPDRAARRYEPGDDQKPSLAWAAAWKAGATATLQEEQRLLVERWLNYYGSARPFEHLSMTYSNAETRDKGFFKDKAVFIGGKPETLSQGDTTDVFGTPFTKWNNTLIPGVEVTALAYANLMHNDWLTRTSPAAELGWLLLTGVLSVSVLKRFRPRTATQGALAFLMAALVGAAAVALVLTTRIWFPWMAVCLIQIPCALLFQVFADRDAIRAAPGTVAPVAAAPNPEEAETIRDGRPDIPDHTLIRCIGEGAYGQVWLARNAIGLYHAVKVVYRSRFSLADPYDRALRGIQKFMPVSRSHEGFVHILHVGRNDRLGFFFYIMEAGDDQKAGQHFDPATYAAKTLATELQSRGTIPPRECLDFILAVTEAVERLHQQQLIHRDIKPDNLIFVNQRPKLADIDLVTDLSAQGKASLIGTEGYMAPEGPGSAAADVFSLGRVLYVALTGKPAVQCPELPTQVTSHPDCSLFLELNQVICRACDFDLKRRYPTAAAMRAQLLEVHRRLDQK